MTPITWFKGENDEKFLTKYVAYSIRFNDKGYYRNFENTLCNWFMNEFFLKEAFYDWSLEKSDDVKDGLQINLVSSSRSREERKRIVIKERKIDKKTFEKITLLDRMIGYDKIVIPEGIEYIDSLAFDEFKLLKEVVFPTSLKSVGDNVFYKNYELKYLTIPVGVENFDWLEYIKVNNKEIDIDLKHECGVTLLYDDFDKLKNEIKLIIEAKGKFISKVSANFGKRFKLKLQGNVLTNSQKNEIKKLLFFNVKMKNVEFIEDNNVSLGNRIVLNNYEGLSEEIKQLIEKINNKVVYLSTDSRKKVLDRVDNLIKEYKEGINSEKPSLNFSDSKNIMLNNSGKVNSKFNLDLELTKIDLGLPNKRIDFIKRLSNCKEILKKNIKENGEKEGSIEDIVTNIVYYASLIGGDFKKDRLEEVEKILDDCLKKNEKALDIGDEVNLVGYDDYSSEDMLALTLSNCLDEIKEKLRLIIPYNLILEVLEKNMIINDYLEDDSIVSLIENIKFVISKIEDEVRREEFTKEFNLFKVKYIEVIKKCLLEDVCSKEGYKKLEVEIRKEIHKLLVKLDEYASGEMKVFSVLNNILKVLDNNLEVDNSVEIEIV